MTSPSDKSGRCHPGRHIHETTSKIRGPCICFDADRDGIHVLIPWRPEDLRGAFGVSTASWIAAMDRRDHRTGWRLGGDAGISYAGGSLPLQRNNGCRLHPVPLEIPNRTGTFPGNKQGRVGRSLLRGIFPHSLSRRGQMVPGQNGLEVNQEK
jgi:hypothetical protein